MEYIVYKEPYTSYGIEQGGYFVSYKDKLSDNFSDKWYHAKRYKTIGPALTRLGIHGLECTSIDDFIKVNINNIRNESSKRDIKLKKILGNDITIGDIISYKGKIEFVENNEINRKDHRLVIDFIIKKIESNSKKLKKKFSYIDIGESSYIGETEDLEFWDNWAK